MPSHKKCILISFIGRITLLFSAVDGSPKCIRDFFDYSSILQEIEKKNKLELKHEYRLCVFTKSKYMDLEQIEQTMTTYDDARFSGIN